jgi:hypothetical protein
MRPSGGGDPGDFLREFARLVKRWDETTQRAAIIQVGITRYVRLYRRLTLANLIVFGGNSTVMLIYLVLRLSGALP